MGISKVSNRWLNRTYKCLAILLVVFAVLISALRLFLPYAHNYRQDLQNYINDKYNSNVIIGSLEMGWKSSGPTLVAANVSLIQTDSAEIYIQAFDMNVDFWGSIRNQRLITRDFSLNGVKVLFDKTTLSESGNDSFLMNNIYELFLSQIGQFSVNDSQVIYRTDTGQRTFLIDSVHWLNQGDVHKASGNVVLDGITSNNLRLNLNMVGADINAMNGSLYLSANSLNITPWLDSVFAIEDENTHSTINFDAWLSIKDGQANNLHVQLGQNQVAWQHQENIRTFNIDKGQIVFDNLSEPSKFTVYSSPIHISSNSKTWQPLIFNVRRVATKLQTYLSNIDIEGVTDLLPLFVEQQESIAMFEAINPVGKIQDVYIEIDEDKLSGVAQFAEVTTQYANGIPGIENVSGQVAFKDQKLQLELIAKNGALDFEKHFKAPIDYTSLSSSLNVKFSDSSWSLTSSNIVFNSDDVSVDAEIGVFGGEAKEVEMSLLATAIEGNAVFAETFYPHLLMGNDLVNYLNNALEKGKLDQALVLVNGPLTSFPYENGGGTFVVDAELTNSTFNFDKAWPAINHFDANLNFTNNSMLITGRSGSLNGISVRGVQAAIEDLSTDQVLTVDATFKDTAPKLVSNLMITSPLNSTVGAVLEKVVVSNNIAGEFHLTLPLNALDSSLAKGTVYFKDNIIDLQSPEMHFTQVNGELAFSNENIKTKDLSFLWREMPLSVEISSKDEDRHYQTNINIVANWQDKQWSKEVPELLKSYGDGTLNWYGELVLKNSHDNSFEYTLGIQSNLQNAQLNLPSPFNKNIDEIMPANIQMSGDEDQSTIDAQIGQQFKFYGNLNHHQVSFSQAHLILGNEPMYLPLNGFHISTNLAKADFHQWQPLVSDILNSLPDKNETDKTISLLEQPERIRGNIGTLNFLDESLKGVSFNLEDQIGWWLLDLSSKEARANVKIYPDWLIQGLEINADFIHLNPQKSVFNGSSSTINTHTKTEQGVVEEIKEATPFDISTNDLIFKNIPTMRLSCADCSYGDLNFGRMVFKLNREDENILSVKDFVAERNNSKLNLQAYWRHDDQNSITQISGEYSSKDIERELDRLGFPSTVKDSGLKSVFDVNWLGGPHDFSVATLNGDTKGELNEGYLAEVPDGARAFSILSLQSLVRKLKFDFRDIFSDGMFYSEIKGDFHIQNGVVYTKNTFLKGAAGDLSVKGNTDLNTETLDYSMSYKPNMTSSLPAIAWIATLNPVTFLAGLAIDEVITSKVISEYKMEVTGSISKPIVKEVDRKTQNISVGRDSPPRIVENILDEKNDSLDVIDLENQLLNQRIEKPLDKSDG